MRKMIGLLAAAGIVSVPGVSAAAGPTLSDVLVNSGLTATGSLQGSYVGGFNKGQTLAYHAFDQDSNTFSFNQANLSLAYQPADGFGGLVNVIAGDDAKGVNAAYGSTESSFSLTQGFVQYAHGPLTVIAGRYVTLAGAEVIDGSLDTNISRSLLFTNAEPLVHTGVRAAYKVTDTVTAYLGLNNSAYGSASDSNKQKTIESGVAYAPTAAASFAVYDYYGDDNSNNYSSNFTDFVGSYKVNDALTLVVNGDWFHFRTPGSDGNVTGVAAYANYAFTPTISGSLRGEYLATKNYVWFDGDGKSNMSEVTATVAYSPVASFTLMGELRYDMGGDKIYPNPSYPDFTFSPPDTSQSKDNQGAVEIKAIFKFGTPPPAAS